MGREKLVIIGGGYAGLSFVEELRNQEDKENRAEIILFSSEVFCSRPNLFFRFKFPGKKVIDYGEKSENFYSVYKVAHKNERIVKVSPEHKFLISERGDKYEFTKLIMCTGSLPNLYMPKKNLVIQANFGEFLNFKTHPDVYLVRNVFETKQLHERLSTLHPTDNVVILGSGALTVDLVSNIFEGYFKNIKEYWPLHTNLVYHFRLLYWLVVWLDIPYWISMHANCLKIGSRT
jgi:NAD(P)H-nitrite reductase large subunit